MDFHRLKLLVLDVDGVLTDGRVRFHPDGAGRRVFDVHDGWAIKLWLRSGGKLALLSGRSSPDLHLRAKELGIETVCQGCDDKLRSYREILGALKMTDDETCYVADDRPDVGPMRACAFAVAVNNAVAAVKQNAAYVTRAAGGAGAVAEVIELLLRKQRRWPGPTEIESPNSP